MTDRAAKAAPPIRFRQFEDAWTERRLGDVSTIGDADHWMPKTISDGIPYVMTGDFSGVNEIDFRNAKRISQEDYEQLSKKIKPEYDDILFARYASIGSVRLIKTTEKFIASYSCAIIKGNRSYKSDYLFFLMQSGAIKKQIEQSINTGSQGNVGIESLKKLTCNFPSDREQQKIGRLFQELDELIKLHQRRREKLVTLKKAMLQKLFPKIGASIPEARFNGFSGGWVRTKLTDIGVFKRGISYGHRNVSSSGLLVVRSSNIQDSRLILDSDLQFIDLKCPDEIRLRKGDLAICMSNGSKALVGKSALCETDPTSPTTVGAFCSIFRSASPIVVPIFQTAQYLKYVSDLLAGSSINNLKNSDLGEMEFRVPLDSKEQEKIGNYFRTLDDLIRWHSAQVKKLHQIKSAYLADMFI